VSAETLTASDAAARVGETFLADAREAGATTALGLLSVPDDPDAAREAVERCLSGTTALVATEAAVAAVFDRDGPPEQVAHAVASGHDLDTVALVRDRTLLVWHDATVYETDTLAADEADPAGAADAFAGTFLARRLAGDGVERALAVGTAAHALARTGAGPLATYSHDDLLAVAGEPPA
jgi:2-dehydro-3-deoxygluconokinase